MSLNVTVAYPLDLAVVRLHFLWCWFVQELFKVVNF